MQQAPALAMVRRPAITGKDGTRGNSVNTPCQRISVIVLTFNRALELQRTLEHLLSLPDPPAIVVMDNASTDATPVLVRQLFPQVTLISLSNNIGAAARNIGVQHVHTPYVAFCDDDSWWASGSLERAVRLLDAHPLIAALCARILVGPAEREDPMCRLMACSPLPSAHLPGPALLGFLACAAVFRRHAFLEAGGYEQKFFVGGEESLLALDLVARGWSLVYASQLTVHHYPSPQRDPGSRRHIMLRNALWVAWLRLPIPVLLQETRRMLYATSDRRVRYAALLGALREMPWVLRNRKVLPPEVTLLYERLVS